MFIYHCILNVLYWHHIRRYNKGLLNGSMYVLYFGDGYKYDLARMRRIITNALTFGNA